VCFDNPIPFITFEVEGVVGDTNSAGWSSGGGCARTLLSASSSYFGDSGIEGGGWLNTTEAVVV
jgi:hypothetical protein